MKHERLDDWTPAPLPAAPPPGFRNFLRVIGPAVIMIGISIGSGEWLIGPAAAVRYGVAMLGIVTIAVLLQAVLNIELMRYTVSTGEPISTGFMRLGNRPRLVGLIYIIFGFFHLGWPAFAAASAAALFAAINGRLPVDADAGSVMLYGYFTFLLALVILIFGKTVERTLERVSWVLMMLVFLFMLVVNVAFIPASVWWSTFKGFGFVGRLPASVDWTLVGAFAAYAGAGGIANLMLSSWARDRGYGMGAKVGAIGGAVGGSPTTLSPTGHTFAIDEESLGNWKRWMGFVHAEQLGVWALFCLIGMFLTVNMAIGTMPEGADITGLAAGAYQAEYLRAEVGEFMWLLALLNGFWILLSTQLAVMDGLVRVTTDIIWTGFPEVRARSGHDVRKVYYTLLAGFIVWGCFALSIAQPIVLILIGANVAGFILTFAAVHIVLVNRRLLPEPLRPSVMREALMLLVAAFYGFFVVMNLLSLFD